MEAAENGLAAWIRRPPAPPPCAFGNPGAVRETLRESRPSYWLDTLAHDVLYGLRLLRRSPILALTILATLTFGIGLCSTIFTIVNAEVFRAC
jgi:hypothetical protein